MYIEKFKVNPRMTMSAIRQNIDEDFKVEMSKTAAYNARQMALRMIIGDMTEQYKHFWEYRAELMRTHPHSSIEIEHEDFREERRQSRFKRMYVCLGPLKRGFIDHCRPLIGVDGCHVKGTYRGQLLFAISCDGNNGWWPITWAVVEKETTEQWRWFFYADLDIVGHQGFGYTFISDRQEGLDAALSEVLPMADHRYCVQHMYNNFKKLYRGKVLKDMLWKISGNTNRALYERYLKELEDYDKDAWTWVKNGPKPDHWVRSFSHIMLSQLCYVKICVNLLIHTF